MTLAFDRQLMRIAVLIIRRRREQPARVAQVRTDRPVGGVELGVDDAALAAEPAPVLAILAIPLDREHGVDAVRLAQIEIVLAMVGRHVDEAGAGVGGDELAGQERARLGEEAAEVVHRVAGDGAGEVGAFDRLLTESRPSSRVRRSQRSSQSSVATRMRSVA